MRTITIPIQNLKCGGCSTTILKKLSDLGALSEIKVNEETSEVSFEAETIYAVELARNELTRLGYPPVGDENSFGRKAKSYISCVLGRAS